MSRAVGARSALNQNSAWINGKGSSKLSGTPVAGGISRSMAWRESALQSVTCGPDTAGANSMPTGAHGRPHRDPGSI